MKKPTQFDFSFNLGNKCSSDFLSKWKRSALDNSVEYQDPKTSLKVIRKNIEYSDPSVREWVFEFENAGTDNTPIINRVFPLDITVKSKRCPYEGGHWEKETPHTDFMLYYAHGGMAGPNDFQPEVQNLGNKGIDSFKLTTQGGRSSNLHMPFFNFRTGENSGMIIAIGWSGQWHCLFDIVDKGQCRIKAGMEFTNLTLYPGEKIRTPSIVVMEWRGKLEDSYNQWRRFLRKHKCLDLNGEKPLPAVWSNSWFTFDCGYGVNEQNQKDTMTGAAKMGIEYLVIDAGWYKCAHPFWWDGVGSWEPRDDTFPNGFTPLKKHGNKKNIKFGIWFEPERAASTSIVAKEHPEWLVGSKKKDPQATSSLGFEHTSNLVNLGLPEVQDWLIELVDTYVKQGMAWFRHDFNIDPLEIWQNAEAPDRQGINEIRYIEGLYRVHDEIHRRHPDLFIEGCASGGRRIDIETIKRNHGYWATDMMCGTPEPMQAHIIGFNRFLLPHWHNTVLQMKNAPKEDSPKNRYYFFSFLGGAPCFCFDMRDKTVNFGLGKKWLDWFKQYRHLTMGDIYPLTEWSLSTQVWMGYQFHRNDLDEGMVVIFRRPESPYETGHFKLAGLKENTDYIFSGIFDQKEFRSKGKKLMADFPLTLKNKPDIAIFVYHAK